MPRKKKEEAVEEVSQETVVETPVEAPTEAKTSFDVYDINGVMVRTYSVEDHGEDAKSLAKEYAGKIGGSVK